MRLLAGRPACVRAAGAGPELDLAATLENAGRVADHAHHEQRLSDDVAGTGIDLVVCASSNSPSDLAPSSQQGGNYREA